MASAPVSPPLPASSLPQGVQGLRHLESLSLVGVQLAAEVVAGMAACTSLQELTAGGWPEALLSVRGSQGTGVH